MVGTPPKLFPASFWQPSVYIADNCSSVTHETMDYKSVAQAWGVMCTSEASTHSSRSVVMCVAQWQQSPGTWLYCLTVCFVLFCFVLDRCDQAVSPVTYPSPCC